MSKLATKIKEKEAEKDAAEAQGAMKKNLRKMFMKKGTLMINEETENSELMRKLRAWKVAKK